MHIYNIHMYTLHIHRSKEFDEDSKKINICMNTRVHGINVYSYMCIHTHTCVEMKHASHVVRKNLKSRSGLVVLQRAFEMTQASSDMSVLQCVVVCCSAHRK